MKTKQPSQAGRPPHVEEPSSVKITHIIISGVIAETVILGYFAICIFHGPDKARDVWTIVSPLMVGYQGLLILRDRLRRNPVGAE